MTRPYRVEANVCLEAFVDRKDAAEPLTSHEVAEAVGIARRTAHKKLEELVDREVLASKQVGARGRVWWVPDDLGVDLETLIAQSATSGGEKGTTAAESASAVGNDE
ncbi:hypothetical protein [Natronosalvus rutilus]|uniref:HTH domain-containing protein n=1 Tax=Natronosalvus rutilus TaxID=2953753 RepID=A0A9E7NAB3_9EURY|nr:hypothetical protein [Natronosalvus rutilus]UTF53258.1 hypothetical protein NGM29_16015 [Natronosalvus rutilus]